jgi:hypothetical protein
MAVALLLAVSLVGLQRAMIGDAQAAERKPSYSADWLHILQVIAAVDANPPKVPAVYLLGGSAARESTISDRSWTAQVRRLGGPRVRTYTLGSNGQSYAQDITIVSRLPAVRSIVLIGVGLGRYVPRTAGAATQVGEQPAGGPGPRPGAMRSVVGYNQHHYSVTHILTYAQKRSFVRWWRRYRYPLFKQDFAGNAAELEQLIVTCQKRSNLYPVLLEEPLNLQIVGHLLDKPRDQCRDSCRALAKKYGIPKIDFLSKVGLVSGDFYDMSHLVEPGRVKWQRQLSKTVISLLKRYDMDSR